MTKAERLDRLVELINRDHGGCDSQTCDISVSLRYGFYIIAIESWASSGAACNEFSSLYSKLPKTYKCLGADWSKECEEFRKIPSIQCPHCNAYLYDPEDYGYHCDSCANEIPKPKESA